jgi:hypothetical protein
MSRRTDVLAPILLIGLVASANAGETAARPQVPLIERAAPDPVRRALVVRWWSEFERQRPSLAEALAELVRERDGWRSSAGGGRCVRAEDLLAGIDREALLAVTDYRLASALGRALDELASAATACRQRRYFELDYRLGLVARELDRVADLTRFARGPRGVSEER